MSNDGLLQWAEALSAATSTLLESLRENSQQLYEPACSQASKEQSHDESTKEEHALPSNCARLEEPQINYKMPYTPLQNNKHTNLLEYPDASSATNEDLSRLAEDQSPGEFQDIYELRKQHIRHGSSYFDHIRRGYRGGWRGGYRANNYKTYRRGSPYGPRPSFERLSR
ncbi:hypothetical protein PTRG_11842 [Pyrenophora tritici-repentis Pt-1C-BFP]|uniref:Uncharacterized protein n=1 Tax=Pyrenophora tritici-repentis (strain Pt-1C-BFP) TaxID=426418 RepID=B2WPB5_PYRTR|nr:uncharacterized protein PTRG_11825 [Pyrenophora tritici-repentis Pt-1C-BFP]XP_001942173.1 uncharacterized protein PTRG_11842 [Pyrenophora tritici-repentis Pt-1C-BFP]EDU45981.1 hypothetical protein PTRG_11825 [Pyrenophora tritici-repentis Pt-1C-BFP]EDU45998.1 hypothetical protein PTRG_11842 [Pyrenophora tritici-repentis Pt-1C-BFP]